MAFGLAGAYTVRASARFSADVTIDMWEPVPHSENRTRGGVAPEIQVSAEASPPRSRSARRCWTATGLAVRRTLAQPR